VSVAIPSSIAVQADPAAASLSRAEWALRIGAAACFIGHGAFGIITKEAWVSYFAVFGMGRDTAFALMPIIGSVDIAAGVLVLLSPRPAGLLYMTVWGLWTAVLRPLAGESAFEAIERAGNYGVPFALLLMYSAPSSVRGLLDRVWVRPSLDRNRVGRVLLWATVLLLFAHGALQAITQKPLFAALYGTVSIPASAVVYIGAAEMATALLLLIAPTPALLVAIAAWKIASESLFLLSGTPVWEFVERAGSYTAPLALALLCGIAPFTRITFPRSSR
jgi:hypothetical protein